MKLLKAKYIKTMDFTFNDVFIMECLNENVLRGKIRDNEVIKIINDNNIEYINSSYIMYYELYEELVEYKILM